MCVSHELTYDRAVVCMCMRVTNYVYKGHETHKLCI